MTPSPKSTLTSRQENHPGSGAELTRFQKIKKALTHEMVEYCLNFVYLTLLFAASTQYRRLVLAAHDISYTNYWFAVIEAAILAKVIMIGNVARLGRELDNRPLILPTLYKSVVFTIFVGIFKLIEHGIKNLWHDKPFLAGLSGFSEHEVWLFLANTIVLFVGFLPFFALKEAGRALGKGVLWNLFFRSRNRTRSAAAPSTSA
jgi:hypothetical protein